MPIPNSLHQSKLRVNWAREKVQDFKFSKQQVWKDALENASDNREAYFLFREHLHEEAIRLTSEFVHHARAALDYIVFVLAWLNTGSEQKLTQFPIDSTPEKFQRDIPRFLKHLSPEHVAMIEQCQPYHGFQWLLLLNALSNIDKHQELIHINFLGMFGEVPVGETDPITGTGQKVKMEMRRNVHVLLDDGSTVEEAFTEILSQVGKVIQRFDRVFG
jgi:hypothetical protein